MWEYLTDSDVGWPYDPDVGWPYDPGVGWPYDPGGHFRSILKRLLLLSLSYDGRVFFCLRVFFCWGGIVVG